MIYETTSIRIIIRIRKEFTVLGTTDIYFTTFLTTGGDAGTDGSSGRCTSGESHILDLIAFGLGTGQLGNTGDSHECGCNGSGNRSKIGIGFHDRDCSISNDLGGLDRKVDISILFLDIEFLLSLFIL